MTDFVAFLRKALSRSGQTVPGERRKVYDRARQVLTAKLEAMNPAPSESAAERQKRALEDAIALVEADFVQEDELTALFNELEKVALRTGGRRSYSS